MPTRKRKPATSPAASSAPGVAPAAPTPSAEGESGDFSKGESVLPSSHLDVALAVSSVARVTAPPLGGALSAPTLARPRIPDELAGDLSPQDHFLVWQLVAGLTWFEALDAAGVPPRGALRDVAIPERIRLAAEWAVQEVAEACGLSRKWILGQWVALYKRAASAEPVYDRRGRPTGEYKLDGATAAKALTALGEEAGMGKGKQAPGYSADQVVELMRAIALRGKPGIEERRPRVIEGEHGAAHTPALPHPSQGKGGASA